MDYFMTSEKREPAPQPRKSNSAPKRQPHKDAITQIAKITRLGDRVRFRSQQQQTTMTEEPSSIIYVAVKGIDRNASFAFYTDESLLEELQVVRLDLNKSYKFVAAGDNWEQTRFYLSDHGTQGYSHTEDLSIEASNPGEYGMTTGQSLLVTFSDPTREIISLSYFSNKPAASYPGLAGRLDATSPETYPFTIEISDSEIKEGAKLVTKFRGTETSAGTKVFWRLDGITEGASVDEDISTGQASDEVMLDENGSAEIFHYFAVDYKEYFYEHQRDVFKLSLFSDPEHTEPVARSVIVKPIDAERAGYVVARFGVGRLGEGIAWATPGSTLHVEEGEQIHFTLRPAQHGIIGRDYFELDEYMLPFNEITVDGKVSARKAITPDQDAFKQAIGVYNEEHFKHVDSIAPNGGVAGWYSVRPNAYDLTEGKAFTLEYIDANTGRSLVSNKVQISYKNIAPQSINLTKKSIDENAKAGSSLGLLSAIDPNAADKHVFFLIQGEGSEDNKSFKLVGNKLMIIESPDFETKKSYSIRVQTRDSRGLTLEKTFAINVNNISNEKIYSAVSRTLRGDEMNLVLTGRKAIDGMGNSLNNELKGNSANNQLKGNDGDDDLDGGAGNDSLIGGAGSDTANYSAGRGTVIIDLMTNRTSGTLGKDILTSIENVVAGAGADRLIGDNTANALNGGKGKDSLTGNPGKDTLTGGEGGDRFIYRSIQDSGVGKSKRDAITDFNGKSKDKIDLSAIDAYTKSRGNQSFAYIGSKSFSGKRGEVRFSKGLLQINTGPDRGADMEIGLTGVSLFQSNYLIL